MGEFYNLKLKAPGRTVSVYQTYMPMALVSNFPKNTHFKPCFGFYFCLKRVCKWLQKVC